MSFPQRLQSQKRRRVNERTHLCRRVRNSGNSPLPLKRLPRKSPTCVLSPPACHFLLVFWLADLICTSHSPPSRRPHARRKRQRKPSHRPGQHPRSLHFSLRPLANEDQRVSPFSDCYVSISALVTLCFICSFCIRTSLSSVCMYGLCFFGHVRRSNVCPLSSRFYALPQYLG